MKERGHFASLTTRFDPAAMPATEWAGDCLDDNSVAQLVLEHYDREHMALRRYVSLLGVDFETRQDIVQETFLRLQQHLRGNGDRANLRAWLYRVAHNLSRNRQTTAYARKTDALAEMAGSDASAEEALLKEERQRVLRLAIAELSPAQKECLILRSQGLKYREMADVLQLSVSTVAENVQRGLERLRKVL